MKLLFSLFPLLVSFCSGAGGPIPPKLQKLIELADEGRTAEMLDHTKGVKSLANFFAQGGEELLFPPNNTERFLLFARNPEMCSLFFTSNRFQKEATHVLPDFLDREAVHKFVDSEDFNIFLKFLWVEPELGLGMGYLRLLDPQPDVNSLDGLLWLALTMEDGKKAEKLISFFETVIETPYTNHPLLFIALGNLARRASNEDLVKLRDIFGPGIHKNAIAQRVIARILPEYYEHKNLTTGSLKGSDFDNFRYYFVQLVMPHFYIYAGLRLLDGKAAMTNTYTVLNIFGILDHPQRFILNFSKMIRKFAEARMAPAKVTQLNKLLLVIYPFKKAQVPNTEVTEAEGNDGETGEGTETPQNPPTGDEEEG